MLSWAASDGRNSPCLGGAYEKKNHRAAHGFGNKSLGGAYDFFRAHSAQCEITSFFRTIFPWDLLSFWVLCSLSAFVALPASRSWSAHSSRMVCAYFAHAERVVRVLFSDLSLRSLVSFLSLSLALWIPAREICMLPSYTNFLSLSFSPPQILCHSCFGWSAHGVRIACACFAHAEKVIRAKQ